MFTKLFWKKVGLSFSRAFVGVFVLGLTGVLEALGPDGTNYSAAKVAVVAAAIASVAAGLRAVQALFTNLESPSS